MLNNFLSSISKNLPYLEKAVFRILFLTWFIWLPVLLIILFWKLWVRYVRALFFSKMKRILLEIKLPKEITKSPVAMELFLTALHQTGREGTWYAKFWEGKTRPWFSLEMVSIEGVVRFFIWTEASFKNIIEAQLYAQYPTVEIYEVPDYTEGIFFDKDKIGLMGTNFELAKSSVYPIKTYVDFGLDKADTKEEYKTDPITPIIEFLGSMGRGEQVWFQIIIRAHKKEQIKKGTLFEKTDAWQDEAKEEIEEIRKEATPKQEDPKAIAFPNPTKGQIEKIAAIERNVSKLGFDCGMRIIYLAEKDKFRPSNIGAMTGITRQFHSNNLNSFKVYSMTDYSQPWQDYKGIRVNKLKRRMLNAYKLRSYFHPPYQKKWFVINTEGLASIFHLPGSVSQTPTFARITSKKAEPPSNLPI